MKLFIDFETRSRVDLVKCGAYVYGHDASTEVLCLVVRDHRGRLFIWTPADFADEANWPDASYLLNSELSTLLEDATEIHAHNANFERCIWSGVMVPKYGFPEIPRDKWHCTAAKAAALALPRSLAGCGAALGLDIQKDQEGRRLMLKLCKPGRDGEFSMTPEEHARLIEYCKRDVETEYAADQKMRDLSETERRLWLLDQKINDAGITVDTESIGKLIANVKRYETELLQEYKQITGGTVASPRQVAASIKWLATKGVEVENLQKKTVQKLLAGELDPAARRLLEIRATLAKSSVSKLDAMARMAGTDQRVRGTLLFHGARTGRWSGRGIQPQNFVRDAFGEDEVVSVVNTPYAMHGVLGTDPIAEASRCLRGMLTAAPGHALLCADFSNIEGRVAAWGAGEAWKLEAFEEYDEGTGPDLYKLAYAKGFNKDPQDVTKEERQVGKVMELALQYQGWKGAFQSMAEVYGVEVDDERAAELCGIWRDIHPEIRSMWYGLEDAAKKAVRTGEPHRYGHVVFGMRDGFLFMKLPSGRLLAYYKPGFMRIDTPYEDDKEILTFWGVSSQKDKVLEGSATWGKLSTYGGKLFENYCQSVARDVMVEAMFRLDAAGFPLLLTVHDEIVAELPEGEAGARLSEFESSMAIVPDWCPGLPVAVEGWTGERYRK